jgi:hypothetical protein
MEVICNSCHKPTTQFFIDNSNKINCIVCHRQKTKCKECPICGRSIHNTSKTCIPCSKLFVETPKGFELKVA